jgi:multisubunit Na+/H+ antiporter MnhF subunit
MVETERDAAHPQARMPRSAAVLGAAWGLTLWAAPKDLLRRTRAEGGSRPARALTRLLGARQIAEAAYLTAVGPRARRPVVVVETLHALTMAVLAVGSHRYRRAAVVSGSVAVALALLTAVEDRPGRMTA